MPYVRGGFDAGICIERGAEAGIRSADAYSESGMADGVEGEEYGGGQRHGEWEDFGILVARDDSYQCSGELFCNYFLWGIVLGREGRVFGFQRTFVIY